ncbi:hypothetical protein Gogos_021820, partial [Gossypium gossypioides]|nr:hypothetical protein [Gossypium gossypioides]
NPTIVQSKYLHSLSIINYEGRLDPRHLAHLLSSCDSISKSSLDAEIRRLPEYHYLSLNLAYINLRSEGAMPCLRRLERQRCRQLKKLPDGLRLIATL